MVSPKQSLLNALVGLTRLDAQVSHARHRLDDPLIKAQRELLVRQKPAEPETALDSDPLDIDA